MIESLMKVITIYHDPSINAWRIELPGGNYWWVSGETVHYAHEEAIKDYMTVMGIEHSDDIFSAMKNPAYADWVGELSIPIADTQYFLAGYKDHPSISI